MNPVTPNAALSALLTRECEQVMSLVDVLSDEQACLINLQADRVLDLAIQKEALMHELESLHTQRMNLAMANGIEASPAALDQWMRELAADDLNLHCLIENFKTSLRQAQRLNNLNGTLVSEQLSTLQQRMTLIQRASQAQTPVTYGPDGLFGSASPFSQRSNGVR